MTAYDIHEDPDTNTYGHIESIHLVHGIRLYSIKVYSLTIITLVKDATQSRRKLSPAASKGIPILSRINAFTPPPPGGPLYTFFMRETERGLLVGPDSQLGPSLRHKKGGGNA